MSAFLVSERTINRVASYAAHDDFAQKHPEVAAILQGIIGVPSAADISSGVGIREFAKCLMDLNELGLVARYGAESTHGERVAWRENYSFHLEAGYSQPYEALKALRCLIYQCSEGDVPESALFKALDQLSAELAMRIVQDSDAYQKAKGWE